MGGQPKFMMCNMKSKFCKMCFERARDDVPHILFECNRLKTVRDAAWEKVISSMPVSMRTDVNSMTPREKSVFILSCYGNTCIPNWTDMYLETINLVHKMYKERADIYNVIEMEAIG